MLAGLMTSVPGVSSPARWPKLSPTATTPRVPAAVRSSSGCSARARSGPAPIEAMPGGIEVGDRVGQPLGAGVEGVVVGQCDCVDAGPRQRSRGLRPRAVGVPLGWVPRPGSSGDRAVGHRDDVVGGQGRAGPRRTASRCRPRAGRSVAAPRRRPGCPRRTCTDSRPSGPSGTSRETACTGGPLSKPMPAPTTPTASTASAAKMAISLLVAGHRASARRSGWPASDAGSRTCGPPAHPARRPREGVAGVG